MFPCHPRQPRQPDFGPTLQLDETDPPPLVACHGLSRRYRIGETEFVALRGVDLVVPAGQFVAITGASGSGKSTLLNLIGGLDRPSAGRVEIEGVDLARLDDAALADCRNRRIGFVFQQFQLLGRDSARRNVELPMLYAGWDAARRRARALELLARFGLAGHADKRPSQLSGGQQQRVAIARALALSPPLILADEPTGALDSATGAEVMAVLRGLCRDEGRTVVMVTHDAALAARTDRIVRCADGRVVADDPVRADALEATS
ncbi:ABC transporter ATP-binding protein [Leptothrix sp. BB-4]